MSTLDDLRRALDRQAERLDDTERYVRPVAVRARIRAVRRRRTTVAVVVAVLVLVSGVAGVAALRSPSEIQPADRVVVGVDVPGGIDVLGFPGRLTRVADLTDDEVHVDPADRDQAVLLAASGLGDGSATLYSQGEPVARVRGDQQVSAPVALGEAGVDLRVRFDGTGPGARAGVAVYEATGKPAAGVRHGDVVFRDEVAGAPLVSAGFTSPGERSVELETRGTGGPLRFVFYCTAPGDLWVNVSIDGDGPLSSTCDGADASPDAGTGSWSVPQISEGGHRVRVYLTDGSDGPEIAPPDGAVVGVGVYDPPATGPRVLGIDVESHVEYGGRTWVLDRAEGAPSTIDTAAEDVLLGLVGRGEDLTMTWRGRLGQNGTTGFAAPGGAAIPGAAVLLAGDRFDVTVDGGQGRLLLYRPL